MPNLAVDVRLGKFLKMRLKLLTPVLVFSILIHSSCNQDETVKTMPVSTDSELALEFYKTGMDAFDQIKLELAYHNLELALKEDPDKRVRKFTMWALSRVKSKSIED